MIIFSWILIIVSIIYGGLTIFGGVIQLAGREIKLWACIMMIIGGILIILPVVAYSTLNNYAIYVLIEGIVLIHIAGISNGIKMYGKINPKQQIVRLMISILIVTLFLVR